MQKVPFESDAIKTWFQEEKRDLPWRHDPSPYEVWISEIMLQQTQVAVVIEYFTRWMQRFPSVKELAEASLEEVLKVWEGLGYYSRVRHLHAAAQYFLKHHAGNIPGEREALKKVKGLGPYTIGALLSFGFHRREAAVDANVARVLMRYYGFEERLPAVREKLWEIAEAILPQEEPWIVVEGLIELGAMICTRQPKCDACPLKKGCKAFASNKQHVIPLQEKKASITLLKRDVMVIHCEDAFLLRKGKPKQVMADLYEFPYCEKSENLEEYMHSHFPFSLVFESALKKEQHAFTRYKVELYPTVWKAEEKKEVEQHHWIPWQKMCALPFSSGHRRVLEQLSKR